MSHQYHRLSPLAFGLAAGLIWAAYVFAAGFIVSPGWAYGKGFVDALSSIYIGYGPSLEGSIIGALWAFIDAFVGGFILIWIYNFFAVSCRKKKD